MRRPALPWWAGVPLAYAPLSPRERGPAARGLGLLPDLFVEDVSDEVVVLGVGEPATRDHAVAGLDDRAGDRVGEVAHERDRRLRREP